MNRQTANRRVDGRRAEDRFRVSFGAKVKVWRNSVLEQLDQEIAAQEQGHRSNYGFRGDISGSTRSPHADCFGQYLDEDCRQHEAGSERNQVLEEPLIEPAGTRGGKQ